MFLFVVRQFLQVDTHTLWNSNPVDHIIKSRYQLIKKIHITAMVCKMLNLTYTTHLLIA